jgi:hypothetical protein
MGPDRLSFLCREILGLTASGNLLSDIREMLLTELTNNLIVVTFVYKLSLINAL